VFTLGADIDISVTMSGLQYTGPLNPNPAEGESRITIYGYLPSLALALTALITFALATIAHTWWAVKKPRMYRTFHILMAVGCVSVGSGLGSWGDKGGAGKSCILTARRQKWAGMVRGRTARISHSGWTISSRSSF
jgi:hypothetical protein